MYAPKETTIPIPVHQCPLDGSDCIFGCINPNKPKADKVDGCNRCPNAAFKEVDHEPLCKDCALSELIDVVERLTTAYVTVTAEVRYDHE
jgi:hypothetical protein